MEGVNSGIAYAQQHGVETLVEFAPPGDPKALSDRVGIIVGKRYSGIGPAWDRLPGCQLAASNRAG